MTSFFNAKNCAIISGVISISCLLSFIKAMINGNQFDMMTHGIVLIVNLFACILNWKTYAFNKQLNELQ